MGSVLRKIFQTFPLNFSVQGLLNSIITINNIIIRSVGHQVYTIFLVTSPSTLGMMKTSSKNVSVRELYISALNEFLGFKWCSKPYLFRDSRLNWYATHMHRARMQRSRTDETPLLCIYGWYRLRKKGIRTLTAATIYVIIVKEATINHSGSITSTICKRVLWMQQSDA